MSQPTLTMTRTPVRQYPPRTVLAIWAAAALPMGVLAWLVVPALTGAGTGPSRFPVALLGAITAGLIWQFVLLLALVYREQRSLRWSVLREALSLGPPTNQAGRRGGRLWWWALAVTAGVAAMELLPLNPPAAANRDFGEFLGSADGQALLHGNWGCSR